MSRSSYRIHDTKYPYFMTSTFVEGFPLFADPAIARIVLDSLTFLQDHREVTLYAYVLMENHFHFIAQSNDLSEKMRHFKSFTARETIDRFSERNRRWFLKQLASAKLNHKIESTYQVWQESFHPKQVFNNSVMMQKINYIHYNPVKRGYVDRPEDWRYSSARNYAGMQGLIPVTLFEP